MGLAPETIRVNNYDYKVELELKTKRNSSAKVYGDTIVLRVSSIIPRKMQKEHISFLLDSITTKLSQKRVKPIPVRLDISNEIRIIGKRYRTIIEHKPRKTCKLLIEDDDVLRFLLPETIPKDVLAKYVKKMIFKAVAEDNEDFLKDFARSINRKYFHQYLQEVRFKQFKSKWGECNSDNVISINVALLFCPVEIMEYILVHEIAHINMLNHSKQYWQRVEEVMPDRKKRERWLRNNGSNILHMNVTW
ncbi:MAG: M48 family metallopeptidase [Cyanobacteriota bacterium]